MKNLSILARQAVPALLVCRRPVACTLHSALTLTLSPPHSLVFHMTLVAFALTFGSFGDILEAAQLAKHIVDMLRKAPGGSSRREALIATLESMCADMSRLTLVFDEGNFTDRLWAEIVRCRSLLDEFHTKLKSYEVRGLLGLLRKTWMVTVEEKELAFWRASILERRAALRDLLLTSNCIQLHEVSEQLGRVGSQVVANACL
ncbi:hypothetical protein FB45DRAFT_929873 [Roridomyces roridus]|uniref:Fungal N-terminal domain-containing protein n=1 Tax=Roridomyces roridus TaxID=1738132 RepID=A0AAD7BGJ0_9AGAR|nr:hypothetical protein FB45DRAFT_929873 [Roridomyces roridus]